MLGGRGPSAASSPATLSSSSGSTSLHVVAAATGAIATKAGRHGARASGGDRRARGRLFRPGGGAGPRGARDRRPGHVTRPSGPPRWRCAWR